MAAWIMENLASIILLLVVAAIVFFLIRSKIKERKQGACGCGCEGCSGCAAQKREERYETDRNETGSERPDPKDRR